MNVVLTKNKAFCVLLQLLMKVCMWHFQFKGVSGMIKWSQPSKEKLIGSAIFLLVFLPPICNFNIREFIISLFLKNLLLCHSIAIFCFLPRVAGIHHCKLKNGHKIFKDTRTDFFSNC